MHKHMAPVAVAMAAAAASSVVLAGGRREADLAALASEQTPGLDQPAWARPTMVTGTVANVGKCRRQDTK